MKWLGEQWIGVTFTYAPRVVEAVKRIPIRAYDPETRTWWVPLRLARDLERAVREARDFTPREQPRELPVADACRVLGVQPDAPACVVRAAYKALSLERHPDRGGSTEAFQRLEAAHAALAERAA
jgi:DnaJ-domain-containing protein 1